MAAVIGERQGRRVRIDEPLAAQERHQASDHDGQGRPAQKGQRQRCQPGGHHRAQHPGQNLLWTPRAQQARVDLRPDDQAGRVQPEQEPVVLGGNPEMLDEYTRRGDDVAEHASRSHSPGERVGAEPPVAQQDRVGAQDIAGTQRDDALWPQRFGHHARCHQQEGERAERHEDEGASPSGDEQDLPAGQRCQDRRHAHDQHEHRQGPGGLLRIEVIANDGTRDHHAGCPAHGLGKAAYGQHFDALGKRATSRRGHVERQPGKQRRLAAVPVGQRPVEDLCKCHAREIDRQGALDLAGCRAEAGRDRGECRQVHVDRDGPDGRDRPHQHKPSGHAQAFEPRRHHNPKEMKPVHPVGRSPACMPADCITDATADCLEGHGMVFKKNRFLYSQRIRT